MTIKYKDLDLNFEPHPTTGDILKKEGNDAIKTSMVNLIMGMFYEKPFRHEIGSHTYKLLFENITPITSNLIKDAIFNVLTNYETRVNVIEVVSEPNSDSNGYLIKLIYIITNTNQLETFEFFLERVR